MPKILLAIPAYNCQIQIERVINGLITNPILLNKLDSIIIIDNRSTDGTVEAALAAIKKNNLTNKAHVVVNMQNYGLGGSHKVALAFAIRNDFDYLAILHGDNQAITEETLLLINESELNPASAAILGSRFMIGSKRIGYSKIRTFGNVTLNLLFTLFSGRVTKDLGSGLNLFKVSELKYPTIACLSNSLSFNIELLLYFYSNKKHIKYVPITWIEEDQISNANTIGIGYSALKILGRWRLGLKPGIHLSNTLYQSNIVDSE